MATNLNFDHPKMDWSAGDLYSEFQRFKQHVEFVIQGPLAGTEKKILAGWLGMWLGQEGREIFKTLSWTDGEQDDHTKILGKYEEYISPKRNKRVARFKAQQRKQKEGENFDTYIKDLKLLVMDCEYADSEDILIDLIINGVRNAKVQEKMLAKKDLKLNDAIEIGQQHELAQSQLKLIRGEEVFTVKKTGKTRPKPKSKPEKVNNPQKPKQIKSKVGHTCTRCGNSHEGRCPAKGTTCNFCKRPDHWAKACRKRIAEQKVHSLDDDFDEALHINMCTEVLQLDSDWDTSIEVSGKQVNFKIDTGAKCDIITFNEFENLPSPPKLGRSSRTLKSFTNHLLKPVGTADLKMKHKGQVYQIKFEVVDINNQNILSGSTAEKLGLIKRVHTVQDQISIPQEQTDLSREFPDLVKTTGLLPGEYHIEIDETVPGVVHPVRKLPAAIKQKAIDELHEMENNGYITKVEEPTEWVSSMVVSVRKDKIRICLDPKDLNKAVKRAHHPMKTIEEVVQDIPGAKVFSVLDAKSGFLQIKLDKKSSYLTTFNTPIGRYRWLRLPFGIKCAPEIYQRIMDEMISGIPGAYAIIDDILIAGKDVAEHDQILKQVIARATSYNLKLNFKKCLIRQPSVPYMGHLVTEHGLKADPDKVSAIVNMPAPCDKEGVRRLLGLVQYLAKFIPNMSEVDAPIRTLLKSDVDFEWSYEQEKSFRKLKELCSSPPVLAFYDVNKDVTIECDSSKDGLGAVIMQGNRAIAYASRALTETEQRYAQIEKEMLSITYSCEKFHSFIFGKKNVTIVNDHKPLEQLFKKPLLAAPMRIQKMMIRLQWYDIVVKYRKGKEMHVSDALSRAVQIKNCENDVADMVQLISVSPQKYEEIKRATGEELAVLRDTVMKGWPDSRSETAFETRPYWDSRDQLSVLDGIVYKGLKIVIPPTMRDQMLKLVHKTHLGLGKSKQRAREVMYWPGMNSDIDTLISNCAVCAEHQNQQSAEPLKPTPTPDLPYEMVGCDIFQWQSDKYLMIVDYYSKYIDTEKLASETTSAITSALMKVFSSHGIPRKMRSDNGPQFSSSVFKTFCAEHGIEHETSSPHFQSSNGEAERAIQTVKRLWSKSPNKDLALLDYRTTPLEGVNLSPAQLLMGRRPRNLLPASNDVLKPSSVDHGVVKTTFNHQKERQKLYYDKRRGVKELEPLQKGQNVRISPHANSLNKGKWTPGIVVERHDKPRSYVVQSENRLYRRNRKHLRMATKGANDAEQPTNDTGQSSTTDDYPATMQTPTPSPDVSSPRPKEPDKPIQPSEFSYRTRSGRSVNKPQKLNL